MRKVQGPTITMHLNGDAITGDVSRSDRKAIGHTHGQIP